MSGVVVSLVRGAEAELDGAIRLVHQRIPDAASITIGREAFVSHADPTPVWTVEIQLPARDKRHRLVGKRGASHAALHAVDDKLDVAIEHLTKQAHYHRTGEWLP